MSVRIWATKTQGALFDFHLEGPGGTPQLSQIEPRQCTVSIDSKGENQIIGRIFWPLSKIVHIEPSLQTRVQWRLCSFMAIFPMDALQTFLSPPGHGVGGVFGAFFEATIFLKMLSQISCRSHQRPVDRYSTSRPQKTC